MRTVLAITALLTFPFLASAQAAGPVGAGFPERSLWLSNTAPKAGEEILIYTVLYNGTNAAVGGTLTFFANDAKLSSRDVSLAPQSSSIISEKWTATAGVHTFVARFVSGADSATQQQTTTIKISVPEPPPPSALQNSVNKATVVASQFASSSAPIVQKIAQEVFAKTEVMRNTGIEYLEKKVDPPQKSKDALVKNVRGFVLGTSTKESDVPSSFLHTAGQLAIAAGLFIMRSLVLFYPFLALLFFVGLYIIYKTVRRPH
ncbi:MAG: hypothetical protein Q7S50_03780 [bacterium]|nr:hypothetical protein [bacterium]